MSKSTIIQTVWDLAEPIAGELGVSLWDVRFEKEGASWFLRILIDREGGANINDCEAMSRRIDPLLDEADPIPQSYYLEVWSAGMNRDLTRDFHFTQNLGKKVTVGLFKPWEDGGEKEPVCILKEYGGKTIVVTDPAGTDRELVLSELRFVRLWDDMPF
ncbi:MAG TPA: ribosome maturation factor RimP [Candidatus Merdivicinus intestinavium]|nr:ribosome maturation factor RimP [Candidatus Merdivicinus intestinavium]